MDICSSLPEIGKSKSPVQPEVFGRHCCSRATGNPSGGQPPRDALKNFGKTTICFVGESAVRQPSHVDSTGVQYVTREKLTWTSW
jgi:hypothetical protein